MSQPAFDFDDVEVDDATNPTYTVGELADAINDQLRRGFTDGVWVRGEIDGLRQGGPHTYFSLVEDGEAGKAVLSVQLFAPMKRRLLPILRRNRLELRDGMKVRIFGHLDFYAQGGRLGLKMAGLDPRYTLGEIAQSRDEIMRRLIAEGLLDTNRRRALTTVPLRVGVVASVESAAWHDFRDEIEGSGFGFRLVVADSRVQGEHAARMVAGAVTTLTRRDDLDVIVVIRGGGARNELAVFDAEPIARAIAASPIPVFTGLGHEIDRSVADEVAHTSLKTPTACAGALIERVNAAVLAAEETWRGIARCAEASLETADRRVGDHGDRIARHTRTAVRRADERLEVRRSRLATLPPATLARATDRLVAASSLLRERSTYRLERAADHLGVATARIASLDPAVQLARGWTITRDADGRVVRSAAALSPGDRLTTSMADGDVTSVVDEGPLSHAAPTESEADDG